MNLYRYFESTVLRMPDKTALVFQDRRFTFRELHARVCRLAAVMASRGVLPGGKVGLICTNSNAYLEIVLAAEKLGAVSEHFNWRLPSRAMAELAGDAGLQLLFLSGDQRTHHNWLKDNKPRPIPCIFTDGAGCAEEDYEALLTQAQPYVPTARRRSGDPAQILYTSGTTGRPKGVVLSVGAMLLHRLICLQEVGWNSADVFLCALPLFHAAAVGVYCTLLAGGCVVILKKYDTKQWLRLAREEEVTCGGLIPNMVDWLSSEPSFTNSGLPALRWLIYAGGPVARPVILRALERMGPKFIQLYGMTEMGPNVTILGPEEHQRFLREGGPLPTGRPLMGVGLRVEDQEGRPCPPGVCGEVLVRGDTMMTGYENRPELTATAIRNGWYHTGDLGYLDENGYLCLVGRRNQKIITGGENVYPCQIEECLRTLEGVEDAAVVGIPHPKWGEAVMAVIVGRTGSGLDEAQVLAHCQDRLPGYMKPRRVVFIQELPRGESGKILYQALRDRYGGQQT